MSRATFIETASLAGQFFSNEDEALNLTASEDVEVALDQLAEIFREVVVTRGALGALGDIEGRRFHAEALATTVIDTTGAGDAAAGAYLGARLQGSDPQSALTSAMAASARVVSGLGAG
jgi:sugar/nucleoside kinase (ribokinase family)